MFKAGVCSAGVCATPGVRTCQRCILLEKFEPPLAMGDWLVLEQCAGLYQRTTNIYRCLNNEQVVESVCL